MCACEPVSLRPLHCDFGNTTYFSSCPPSIPSLGRIKDKARWWKAVRSQLLYCAAQYERSSLHESSCIYVRTLVAKL